MTNAKEKKLIEMIEETTNMELLEFHKKFRQEKKFMSDEDIEIVQNLIDDREKLLKSKDRG